MTVRYLRSAVLLAMLTAGLPLVGAQAPATVDTSKIGPQVGAVVPAFEGSDQNGTRRSLASVTGPRGTMLVFFRSADW